MHPALAPEILMTLLPHMCRIVRALAVKTVITLALAAEADRALGLKMHMALAQEIEMDIALLPEVLHSHGNREKATGLKSHCGLAVAVGKVAESVSVLGILAPACCCDLGLSEEEIREM
jgi:hypothetical protein